jgi:tetratricopeptide (TPR) repeat protein
MRRVAAAIGVLALVAAAVALGRLAPSSKSEMTTGLLPHLIAVFPFDVQAGPEQQHLGFAMMTLLSYSLDGVGQLRTTDPQALTGELEHSGGMTADVERAREIARQLRAGHYVLGTVVGAGSGVAVTWSLYDTERGGMAVGTNSVTGAVEDVRFMATGVARQLLTQRALIAPSQFSPPVAELGTESYQALVAYLCGVEHLLRGRYDSAVLALERAVAEDSTFAQAWYRLLWAYDWAQTDRVARRDPIQRLRRLRGKLSVKERLIVDIQTAWETGDAESMERLALQATTQFPDYLESWYHLGLVRDFFRWRQPQPLDAALDAYARAFALDPTYPQLLWNYSWALRRGRQHVLVDSLYDQARARGSPIVFTTAHDAFTAYLFGGETARDSVIGVLDRGFSEHTQVPLHSTVWTNQWLHSTSDSLALARRLLWAVMVDPQRRPPDTQALGHRYLATVALAAGRWREAMTEAAASARAQPELAVLGYGLLALTPFVPLARADLVALRDSLLQVRSWPVMFRDIGPDLRSYLLGVLSARLGEETAALRYAAALEQGAASADSARLASDLALEIRAMVESARNRPDDALRTLEGQRLGLPDADGIGSRWLYPFVMLRPLGRLLRADLLLQSGRYEEALRWFDSYPSLNGEPIVDWAYLSHTYGRMAEIHEALGRNDSAIAYYNRLIARWKNADSLLQPRVAAARAAVRRLGAEGRE